MLSNGTREAKNMTQAQSKQKTPQRKTLSADLLEELHLLAALATRQDETTAPTRQQQ